MMECLRVTGVGIEAIVTSLEILVNSRIFFVFSKVMKDEYSDGGFFGHVPAQAY
jgi:hypothetical protein